nr:MAG TPA: hypothetical protein [Caudoviricetes sp.]
MNKIVARGRFSLDPGPPIHPTNSPIPTVSHSLLPQRVPCKPRPAHKPHRTQPSSTYGTGTAPKGGTRP